MWCLAMAFLTPWHCLVNIVMTLNTGNLVVLGGACSKQLDLLAVTCAAVLIGSIRTVGHNKRHVGLVTFVAVIPCHVRRVRLVTLQA